MTTTASCRPTTPFANLSQKVKSLSDARKKAIRESVKTYSIEDFKRSFEMAESSSFLKGENDRNWNANFDWLVKKKQYGKKGSGRKNIEDRSQEYETPLETRENRFVIISRVETMISVH